MYSTMTTAHNNVLYEVATKGDLKCYEDNKPC